MTSATNPASTPIAEGKRRRGPARAALRVALGLAVGCAIAEGAFWLRDQGAFPHVNFYVADPALGVRLRPGATERIRFSGNPVTRVRINAEGFRGADWPASTGDEVVVVGDSQAFGLGVEEGETFSAVLQDKLGKLVRNQGVPTYGPAEYNAVLAETLAKRPAKTVVYLVNLSNDLFEATRPNRDRHAVWDGWAVRKETAPANVTNFPGRRFVFGESHGVYALRRFLYERGTKVDERGFASEGTFHDIGDAAHASMRDHRSAEREATRLVVSRAGELRYAKDNVEAVEQALDSRLNAKAPPKLLLDEDPRRRSDENYLSLDELHATARLSPGDIVTFGAGEGARDVRVTAEHIRRGAQLRRELEKAVREKAEQEKDRETLALFNERETMQRKADELAYARPQRVVPLSPLTPALREAKSICDKHGARLVVVALPVDVQVSPAEWNKYGVPPVDMKDSRILLSDVVVAAESVGAEGIDATPALEKAEPGAFLDGDLHMTAKGHRAIGEAIAKKIQSPRLVRPGQELPKGRSWPPAPIEWTPSTEIVVRESDPAGCETKVVREWFGAFCRNKGAHKAPAFAVTLKSGVEVTAGAVPGGAMLVAPLLAGQSVRATFAYEGATRELSIDVSDKGVRVIEFSKPGAAASGASPANEAATKSFCSCVAEVTGGACANGRAAPDPDCVRTYEKDCTKLVACAAGDPAAPPACPEGFAPAGAAHRCAQLCAADLPCKIGRCTEWQGGSVCM